MILIVVGYGHEGMAKEVEDLIYLVHSKTGLALLHIPDKTQAHPAANSEILLG